MQAQFSSSTPLDLRRNKIRSEGIDRLEHFLDTGEIPPDVVQPSDPTKPKKARVEGFWRVVFGRCTKFLLL